MVKKLFAALMLVSLSASAQDADEARLRAALQAKLPKVPIDSIARTPFPGIFEVVKIGRAHV